MNILSLFDGMSVAQQALKNIGVKIDKYYASEIDQYAIAVTQNNHPDTIQLGSVIGLTPPTGIDLLVGGSPCQDLSIAKQNRKGLSGERSGLFYEYARILKEAKPKYFVLENVASMPKEAREQISEILGVEPALLNAAKLSAQNRKRFFWVGSLQKDGTYKKVEIPQPEDAGIYLKDIVDSDVDEKYYMHNFNITWRSDQPKTIDKKAGALRVGGTGSSIKLLDFVGGINNKDWARDGKKLSRNYPQGNRVYGTKGKSATLSANGGGQGANTGLYVVALRNRGSGKKPEYNGTSRANSLTTVYTDSMVQDGMAIRKLTPVECLRLQSMPDNYFDKATYKNKPISDTQRYKMCGNAFNCAVIGWILSHLSKM